MSAQQDAEVENFDAKISRSTNNRCVAWDGVDPNLCPEKTGHKSDEIRQHRQDGFLNPVIRPVLFLYPVCRSIPLAYCDDAPVFPFRDSLVAFAIILIGESFIFPNWISLIYLAAATWLFHRQVLHEEEFGRALRRSLRGVSPSRSKVCLNMWRVRSAGWLAMSR